MGAKASNKLKNIKKTYIGSKSVPTGLKTKTQWAADGYVLKKYPVVEAFKKGDYGTYALYSIASVRPKVSKIQRTPASSLPLTSENIGECLHLINKAAKRRRDSGRISYSDGNHRHASRASNEKYQFYNLKDRVLNKAIQDGLAILAGYHTQNHYRTTRNKQYHNKKCDCNWCLDYQNGERYERGWDIVENEINTTVYLECYEFCGYRFHMPVCNHPTGVEVLDLGDWLSKVAPRDSKVRQCDAIATLEAYLAATSSLVKS